MTWADTCCPCLGPARHNELADHPSKETVFQAFADTGALSEMLEAADVGEALALAAEGSKACRGKVEMSPAQSAESIQALLAS